MAHLRRPLLWGTFTCLSLLSTACAGDDSKASDGSGTTAATAAPSTGSTASSPTSSTSVSSSTSETGESEGTATTTANTSTATTDATTDTTTDATTDATSGGCGADGESCCDGDQCNPFHACDAGVCLAQCEINACVEAGVLDGNACKDAETQTLCRDNGGCPKTYNSVTCATGCDVETGLCAGCEANVCQTQGWGDTILCQNGDEHVCVTVDGCFEVESTAKCNTCFAGTGCCGELDLPCCPASDPPCMGGLGCSEEKICVP